ncbi:hypothetical protein EBZ80_17020 [bacterium]|nr:hypothetical protein [bacterium]
MPSVFDWSTTASSNGTVDGINIAEGCPPANINNAIRSAMAIIRSTFASGLQTFLAGSTALPVVNGGTGATTAAGIRSAAGLGSIATQNANAVAITGGTISGLSSALAIASGGTGATTASAALTALGGLGVSSYSFASPGYIKLTNGLLLQWGIATVAQDSSVTVTFPVAFTTFAVPVPAAVAKNGQNTDNQNTGYVGHTLSNFTIWNADDFTASVPWIAIGV